MLPQKKEKAQEIGTTPGKAAGMLFLLFVFVFFVCPGSHSRARGYRASLSLEKIHFAPLGSGSPESIEIPEFTGFSCFVHLNWGEMDFVQYFYLPYVLFMCSFWIQLGSIYHYMVVSRGLSLKEDRWVNSHFAQCETSGFDPSPGESTVLAFQFPLFGTHF